MWSEKTLKIMPALLFLFCLLGVFELGLIINDMNKTEKLEAKVKNNLKLLEKISNSFSVDIANLQHHKE
ncbi:hypothetical protein E5Q04_02640 [Helicobacter pylori]|nr:hypothetical protein E5Q04_02640 [Helicobacter pylori]